MAEKTNQQVYPLAPSNGNPRSDEESNTLQSKELKRKKRIKLAIYIAAFAVFQTIVILVFALTVMRVRTPKVSLGTDVTFSKLNSTGNETSSPSFNITFIAQVRVKNTNFGPYKYEETTAIFKYRDVKVGQVTIPKGKAGLRSTKKVSVTVDVNLNALQTTSSNLGNDLKKEVLTLNGQAKFTGKVELMFVMKKKKATEMNCRMIINLTSKILKDLICE
ncbi:late embryogenesis abundant protein At1g64065 [Quercus suber]|uniref:Late embryogenesis abundant protein n=1 Tax=Quercus suber TaxID=58331 RepID=A0AAW0IV81_QUESU|nr:late embryogenesis abundant protein At1g64065-like [Quercus suber]POF11959.1 late embryogenesis abundant protein [Quercus suber]